MVLLRVAAQRVGVCLLLLLAFSLPFLPQLFKGACQMLNPVTATGRRGVGCYLCYL